MRLNHDYNSEGEFFSAQKGIVYHEEAKEVYGIMALSVIVVTGLLLSRLITRRKVKAINRTLKKKKKTLVQKKIYKFFF